MTAPKNGNDTPEKLRQKAKDLLAQADRLEERRLIQVGKLTVRYYQSGFEGFDEEKFRKEIEEVYP